MCFEFYLTLALPFLPTGRPYLVGEYQLYQHDSLQVEVSQITMPQQADPRIASGGRILQLYAVRMLSNTHVQVIFGPYPFFPSVVINLSASSNSKVPFGDSACGWFNEFQAIMDSPIDPTKDTSMEATVKYDEPSSVRIYLADCLVGTEDAWDDGNIVDDFRDEEAGQSQVQPFAPINFQLRYNRGQFAFRTTELTFDADRLERIFLPADPDPTISLAKYNEGTVDAFMMHLRI